MAKINWQRRLALIGVVIFSLHTYAYNENENEKPKVEYYQADDVTNQIPLFDNRFRIDAELAEITMIFYRKAGSKPIILVRPDGSKLRVNNYDKEQVQWYDDSTFDMIIMKRPMPGPWQAVGDILPNSEIFVVSDVKIAVPPLPEIIISGETVKIAGKLINGDVEINDPKFRHVVQLDVEFISTNNAKYQNFGADLVQLTSFRDDGQLLDEYAGDGIFTGEFDLEMAPGEWIPIYKIALPMIKRELRQKPVMLRPIPVTITVDVTKQEREYHQVHFVIDPTFVDPDSLIFQGKITYPDRQDEPFSIMEGVGVERVKAFGYTEPGVHRINANVFGKTINGREFRLVMPEFSFNVDRNEADILAHIDNLSGESAEALNATESQDIVTVSNAERLAQELEQLKAEQMMAMAEQQQQRWIAIAAGNTLVLIIGLAWFFMLRRKKRL